MTRTNWPDKACLECGEEFRIARCGRCINCGSVEWKYKVELSTDEIGLLDIIQKRGHRCDRGA